MEISLVEKFVDEHFDEGSVYEIDFVVEIISYYLDNGYVFLSYHSDNMGVIIDLFNIDKKVGITIDTFISTNSQRVTITTNKLNFIPLVKFAIEYKSEYYDNVNVVDIDFTNYSVYFLKLKNK